MSAASPQYRLFEVTGVELEYPVVDANLRPQALVESLFRKLAGRPTSEVEYGGALFSNELAAHMFETKTLGPERSLPVIESNLAGGVRAVNEVLRREWGARLLPTGMHPFMNPAQGRTWQRAGKAIYDAYAGLFDLRGHGWMNVHSCHINLPFGTEAETVLLHNAICCLLPYLPALAASSPIYEGKLGPAVDNRLAFYRTNQARFPRISGEVIPEYMESFRQYRRDVLEAIYRDLRKVPGTERLRHEWINSRGAIVRFYRDAIEIRVLDTQECPKMDLAVVSFVRAVLKDLVAALREGALTLPEHPVLVDDYNRVVHEGSAAVAAAPHLRGLLGVKRAGVGAVLEALFRRTAASVPKVEADYVPLVSRLIEYGNLSERIRRKVRRIPVRSRTAGIREIYEQLAVCLETNTPWKG